MIEVISTETGEIKQFIGLRSSYMYMIDHKEYKFHREVEK